MHRSLQRSSGAGERHRAVHGDRHPRHHAQRAPELAAYGISEQVHHRHARFDGAVIEGNVNHRTQKTRVLALPIDRNREHVSAACRHEPPRLRQRIATHVNGALVSAVGGDDYRVRGAGGRPRAAVPRRSTRERKKSAGPTDSHRHRELASVVDPHVDGDRVAERYVVAVHRRFDRYAARYEQRLRGTRQTVAHRRQYVGVRSGRFTLRGGERGERLVRSGQCVHDRRRVEEVDLRTHVARGRHEPRDYRALLRTRDERVESRPGSVDSGEDRSLPVRGARTGESRRLASHGSRHRPELRHPSEALRLVLRPAERRQLGVRLAQKRIVLSGVVRERRSFAAPIGARAVELERRPGTQPRSRTARKAYGIHRRIERFARHYACHLVLPMAVARRTREDRHDHVRAERSYHGDDIAQNRVVRPVLKALFRALGESEVVGASEILVRAIESPRREQLLGADDAERLSEIVADEILAAVAARQREIRHVGVFTLREPGDEPRVLVVRVRSDHENAHRHSHPLHQFAQRRSSGRPSLSRHHHWRLRRQRARKRERPCE